MPKERGRKGLIPVKEELPVQRMKPAVGAPGVAPQSAASSGAVAVDTDANMVNLEDGNSIGEKGRTAFFAIKQLFDKGLSPARKQQKHAEGTSAGEAQQKEQQNQELNEAHDPPNPFDRPQSAWLKHALGKIFMEVDSRFEKNEGKLEVVEGKVKHHMEELIGMHKSVNTLKLHADTHEATLSEHRLALSTAEEKIEDLKRMADTAARPEHEDRMAELEKKMKQLEEASTASTVADSASRRSPESERSHPSTAATSRSAVAPPNRKHAVIANLGWDLGERALKEKAIKVLKDIGLTEDTDFFAVAPGCKPGGRGSLCTVHFRTEERLQEAKDMLRAAEIHCDNSKGSCWMDIRRTWEERAPGRKLARLKALITEYRIEEPGASDLQMHFRDRTIKCDEKLIAFLGPASEVEWTGNATAVLNEGSKVMIAKLVAGLA